ncbi:MAG: beta-glucuronidase [Ignavibacteriae bacterium]|nr:beta-glucuronidase [Ignavibacteriota bacterium]
MLNIKENKFRTKINLCGLWNFRVDRLKIGEQENWYKEYKVEFDIAVPGSWNEQLETEGLMNYLGDVWYQKEFFIPKDFNKGKIFLRIDSADYHSKLWINGTYVGENIGGFLPFEFDITNFIKTDETNLISLKVDNELNCNTIPQGISSLDYEKEDRIREETYPPTRFDYFPFGGIHRPIYIYSTPKDFIHDVKIKSKIISDKNAKIIVTTLVKSEKANLIRYEISHRSKKIESIFDILKQKSSNEINIENCQLWEIENPFLYKITIILLKDEEILDSYEMDFGVREIKVDGVKLLLNNKPIFLKGFGKHEDFPIIGKGLNLPLLVKDFSLLKWINANSFRTSHYPYAEEWLDFADKKGILVIDEIPAVSLDFRKITEHTLSNHKDFIKRLIDRDYNHPSVIMWAPGNEPNLVGESSYYNGSGDNYWKEICSYTKSLDDSRPITIPNCQRAGIEDPVFKYSDIISLNRYYGWYENPGNLETAIIRMEDEMDVIANKYKKPVIVTEFGTDTVPGFHSISDQMYTEEYQSKFLELYCNLIESKNYTVGEHVWNFADFKTPQNFRRVVNNLKGVFTRTRDPKQAAFVLKRIWNKNKNRREL